MKSKDYMKNPKAQHNSGGFMFIVYFIAGMATFQMFVSSFSQHMDQKYKTFNLMNKSAGMDSRRAKSQEETNKNYQSTY